jgi:hypothetical protein
MVLIFLKKTGVVTLIEKDNFAEFVGSTTEIRLYYRPKP